VPVASAPDGAWLSWNAHGQGEPLLMIMGLSGSARAWYRLVPHVERRYEAIVFDNRGTGNSDRVTGPLTMKSLADDALAVLDAAGHETAHVMGVSMGGMIAQHLALDHRERVRSLILGCTTAGGAAGAPSWRLMTATALRPLIGAANTFPLLAPALYAEATRTQRPDRVREDLRIRLDDATELRTTLAQMAAIARHDTRSRLRRLRGLEVTVIHGEEDVLVAPDRGRELAASIPGARLVMIPSCGHMLTTDAEEEVSAAVLEHLERVAEPSSRAA
jgi:3-oxoadipate enol-lactonase